MLIGIEDKEKIKNIMLNYMRNTNITAYELNKRKIISNKTLKKILENSSSKISLTTISTLNEKIPFNKIDKKIINDILKKYEVKPKKNKVVKKALFSQEIFDTLEDTLMIAKKNQEMLEEMLQEIKIPTIVSEIKEPKKTKEEEYFTKRKISSFNSDFDNRTLLITKIWDFNNIILDKWKEVDLLLGINNPKDNKKIKKALITIANNLKEISFKLENAVFDSKDIKQEEIIIIKEDK